MTEICCKTCAFCNDSFVPLCTHKLFEEFDPVTGPYPQCCYFAVKKCNLEHWTERPAKSVLPFVVLAGCVLVIAMIFVAVVPYH